MSAVGKVNIKYTFGLNPNSKNSIALVEDHNLVYACGHQAVIVNTESKEQSFIPGSQHPYQSQGITAIACNTPKKIIAIAEKADPVGAVALYDSQTLRRRKILQHNELGSKEIACVAFSNDGRLCVTQGAGPEWNLVLWNVERAVKVIGTVKISLSDETPVNQVSFCPWDSNVIVVIGKGFVRLFRVTEGQLRPISVNVRRDSHTNFLTHAWLWEEKLLLGTEGGEIILLENLEFRAVIYPVSGETVEPMPILSLYPVAKGFIAGTIFGDMWIFEMSEDVKEQYQREEPITVPGAKGGVICIVGSVDDSIVCATDTRQLYTFNMSNLGAAKENGTSAIDYLLTSFHGPGDLGDSSVVGIDTALWRPVIATCGKDFSVRVWNVQDRKMEIMKYFQEEPFSVALHPNGLYIAVGFTDKIQLMSILLDDLTTTREFHIRSCSVLKFSLGGHLLACGNGANVQIFSTYTGTMITSLRHTAKVRAVSWLNMDSKILTVSQEGSVFIWSLDKEKSNHPGDSYSGVLPITSGCSLQDGSKAFTVAADMIVKEIQLLKTVDPSTGTENPIRPPRDVAIDRHISCVTIQETKKLLFLGTSEPDKPGAILSIITAPHLASQFETTVLHSGYVSAMALSPDGDTLYTADAHGCLIISDIEGGGTSRAQQLAKARALTSGAAGDIIAPSATVSNGVAADFVEDILIHKADLDSKRQKVNDLIAKVEELTLNNEHSLRVKEIEHKETVSNIRNKFTAQLNSERFTYENMLAEKNLMEETNAAAIDQLQVLHEAELSGVEDKYKMKLNAEAVRHRQLAAETEEVHKRWNEENRNLVEAHQSHLQSLTTEYELKLSVEQAAQKNLRHEKEIMQHNHDVAQDHVERDIDIEITEMKAKYEARIKFEEEASVSLNHEHTVMKRSLQMLNKDTEQQLEEIKRLKDKEDRLVETIHSLEKDIQSHKKEIREREETITDKEKRIFDLKKKNQELEKFRFVLDYKIKELKLQIAPREAEITTMRKQIEEMDLELEQYHKSNAALLLMISELKLKIEGLRRELVTQDDRIVVNSGLIDRFMKDLKEAYASRLDHPILKSKVVNLFRMYVQEDVGGGKGESGAAGPEDPQLQYNRDREQMERSMDALRRSLHTDAALQKRDMNKMMRESVVLTRELNELRKDEQTLQMKLEAVERVQKSANKSNILTLMVQYGLNSGKETSTNRTQPNVPPLPPTGTSRGVKRSTALRSSSAGNDGGLGSAGKSKSDLREAWRELEMQTNQIANLEDQLRSLCLSLNVDFLNELGIVDEIASGAPRPIT